MTRPPRGPRHRRQRLQQFIVGDARSIADQLPAGVSLNATITSPPYFDAVDYGVPDQIGHGQTYAEYLDDMASILAQLFARTHATGSLWLIMDSVRHNTAAGIPRLVPVPFDIARIAEEAGWTLCDVVIWRKDKTLPWSRGSRMRNAFEYILFLAKSAEYTFNLDAVRDTRNLRDWWHHYPERYNPLGAAPTNVWEFPIPVQGSWSNGLINHRCPLPPALVRRIVDISTSNGDVVCDPFAGVGTVPAVAAAAGRSYFALDLDPSSVDQFFTGMLPEAARSEATPAPIDDRFSTLIAHLRHAKHARYVAKRVVDHGYRISAIKAESAIKVSSNGHGAHVGSQLLSIYGDAATTEAALSFAKRLVARPPLSKFGIEVEVRAFDDADWTPPNGDRQWTTLFLDKRVPVAYAASAADTSPSPLILIDIPVQRLRVPDAT